MAQLNPDRSVAIGPHAAKDVGEGLGLFVGGETPEEFAKVMRSDADIYARIIKQANIKLN